MLKKSFIINGIKKTVIIDPESTLADVLRKQLFLTGTKVSRNEGHCGACSVILNGKLVLVGAESHHRVGCLWRTEFGRVGCLSGAEAHALFLRLWHGISRCLEFGLGTPARLLYPHGRLVPFCAYSLTDKNGKSLYRNAGSKVESQRSDV